MNRDWWLLGSAETGTLDTSRGYPTMTTHTVLLTVGVKYSYYTNQAHEVMGIYNLCC